jgi:hypothetical protein
MRIALLFLCLAACDNPDGGAPDLAVIGTCPAATACNADDHCVYSGFEPVTCVCVTPERVSCCSGGAGANCMSAQQGGVCCGTAIPGGVCTNGCRCVNDHWDCPMGDGGA